MPICADASCCSSDQWANATHTVLLHDHVLVKQINIICWQSTIRKWIHSYIKYTVDLLLLGLAWFVMWFNLNTEQVYWSPTNVIHTLLHIWMVFFHRYFKGRAYSNYSVAKLVTFREFMAKYLVLAATIFKKESCFRNWRRIIPSIQHQSYMCRCI